MMKSLFQIRTYGVIFCLLFYCAGTLLSQSNSKEELARSILISQIQENEISRQDLLEMRLLSESVSASSGITHLYFQQHIFGIPVKNAILDIHLDSKGHAFRINKRFTSPEARKQALADFSLSASDALKLVIKDLGIRLSDPQIKLQAPSATQLTIFQGGNAVEGDIRSELIFLTDQKGRLRLSWQVEVFQKNKESYWELCIDASQGLILSKRDHVIHCDFTPAVKQLEISQPIPKSNNPYPGPFSHTRLAAETLANMYNVYAMPVESPNHGARTIVSNPSDGTASPYGWHDTNGVPGAEYTITRGNNVHAYEDGDNPGFSPNGGVNLVFDYPVNATYSPSNQSEAAAVSNLFYWSNLCHDLWYAYGFDEASGNFQQNNYGRGGIPNDWLNAEAQDGSGSCNANMLTPPDGSAPRMQMYLCNSNGQYRDGDFDNGVIVHEYGHGVSLRLVGGAANTSCLSSEEQMGEGWSDWMGLMMTITSSHTPLTNRSVGTWLFGQAANGSGIRTYPYTTDMAVNPDTYDAIKSANGVHRIGSIWAAIIWEVSWALIDRYGFNTDLVHGNGGNNMAMHIVVEGMKLTPCNPGFVDARDAILAADQALYGGANQCILWEAFAKRGLGYSAIQGSPNSKTDGTEAFDLPPSCFISASPSVVSVCKPAAAVFKIRIGAEFNGTVNLSANGVPGGAIASFNPPSGSSPDSSVLTISNTNAVPPGTYSIEIIGNDGSLTRSFFVDLIIQDAVPLSPVLLTPVNGSTALYNPKLSWSQVANAEQYIVELATDPGFSQIVLRDTVDRDSTYKLRGLMNLTNYHWRVKGSNSCGQSAYSTSSSFTTANILCYSVAATDVPIVISSQGASIITSQVNFPHCGDVVDVNITNLNISHSYIDDLIIELTSPSGTKIKLLDRPCADEDNIFMGLDDQANSPDFPCPPVDGMTYQPVEALSAFDDEVSIGIWKLTVTDGFNFDGGSLNGWTVQICYIPRPGPSVLCFRDQDGDGFGDINAPRSFCGSCGTAYVQNSTDCNDSFSDTHPGAVEICDFRDNDCDGLIDEGFSHVTCWLDGDGDGYGDPDKSKEFCANCGQNYVSNMLDCDDENALINPGANYSVSNVQSFALCHGTIVMPGEGLKANGLSLEEIPYSFVLDSLIPIPDNDSVSGLNISIHLPYHISLKRIISELEITHTYVGDLDAILIAPDGITSYKLFDRPGIPAITFGCPSDNLHLRFDDKASFSAANLDSTCLPSPPQDYAINGTYQPVDALDQFAGMDGFGDWTLRIRDRASLDFGQLRQWKIYFYAYPPTISWWTAATGGVQLDTGMVFNPAMFPVEQGGVDVNIPGTKRYWAQLDLLASCGSLVRLPADFTVQEQISAFQITGLDSVCWGFNEVLYDAGLDLNRSDHEWNFTGSGSALLAGSPSHELRMNFPASAGSGTLTAVATNSCDTIGVSSSFQISIASAAYCNQLCLDNVSLFIDNALLLSPRVQSIYRSGKMIRSDANLSSPANLQFKAGEAIEFFPGFLVNSGARLVAEIESCPIAGRN